MSKFGDLFASRDSEHHYGQKVEMLGSTGFAHEANPHRVCVASAQQPQKIKSNPYVYYHFHGKCQFVYTFLCETCA